MSADLDDFFAKKDKHRKKKTKGISNDDFVQKYENKCKETSMNDVKENTSIQLLSNLEGFVQDDGGEWNDFEDENKDYSDLKIQALTIDDDEQRAKEEEELNKNKESNDTPWGRKEQDDDEDLKNINEDDDDDDGDDFIDNDDINNDKNDQLNDDETLPNENNDDNDEEKNNDKKEIGLSDIVKSMKLSQLNRLNKSAAGGGGGTNIKNISNKKAPKIDDVAEFPDLGATAEAIADAKTFQPVRSSFNPSSSSLSRVVASTPAPPLPKQNRSMQNDSFSSENKFNALRKGWN